MDARDFQKRTGWQGDVKKLLTQVCEDYKIGEYTEHQVVLVGYEDFNIVLTITGVYSGHVCYVCAGANLQQSRSA